MNNSTGILQIKSRRLDVHLDGVERDKMDGYSVLSGWLVLGGKRFLLECQGKDFKVKSKLSWRPVKNWDRSELYELMA